LRRELSGSGQWKDASIHAARKRIKKIRAIADLVRAEGGHGLHGSRKRLRRVSHLLARLRDAAAMVNVLATLQENFPEMIDGATFARVRRRLVALKRRALADARSSGSQRAIHKDCKALQKRAAAWRLEHRQFAALAPGIREAYRRGRETMIAARKTQAAEAFHAWRKRVKSLWYDLRLIEEYSPPVSSFAAMLGKTARWLGDDHDSVGLCERLSRVASAKDAERIRAAAFTYQEALRRKALSAGERLYARRPGLVVSSAARAWQASQ
jgi:CHAD domain-containing protein